jgi:hypothetical protein
MCGSAYAGVSPQRIGDNEFILQLEEAGLRPEAGVSRQYSSCYGRKVVASNCRAVRNYQSKDITLS